MNILTGECKHVEDDPCIGGYARIVAVVKRLQQTRSNPIYFNAGDNFVGTIWYKIGRWNITSYFLNMHKADVMVSEHTCYLRNIIFNDEFFQDGWKSRI